MTEHQFEGDGGDVVPLEPLANRAGSGPGGIGQALRAVFDVLYEAGEALTIDEIAERAYLRVHPAVRYHAKRAYLRDLTRQRSVSLPNAVGERGISERHAWRQHVAHLVRNAVRRGVLIREGTSYSSTQRYAPNPSKAPRIEQFDGTMVHYTPEVWRDLSARERASGEIHAMSMEADRVLRDLDADSLRQAVALVARNYLEHRVDERALRGRLLWLMERPTTDAGRAWLLNELVRRAYGSDSPAG